MARSSSGLFRAIWPSIITFPSDDLDRLPGQSHHPLHVGLGRLAREVEDRHLPAPGRRKS